MDNNCLGFESLENLNLFFKYVSINKSLSILNIDNNFGDADIEKVKGLAKAIGKNKSIEQLDICEEDEWSDNNIKIIENAIKNSTSISKYVISFTSGTFRNIYIVESWS